MPNSRSWIGPVAERPRTREPEPVVQIVDDPETPESDPEVPVGESEVEA